ncbi:uncharacterized protein PGTG_16266 [Puccinia graminis f. sp. tritici CRL 75-36-700-3]|uniref:Geranylgeranyl transferase type-2 subunit alpha n=2 Tax=Puccinia graminis f. sp. tritici (strain CRL 75-36-700-3 / race SCCL) TaxID=418459 RepID=E3L091_PUCGT|nr:uncharacterized protein PGTG_16266 [Puccinia graminis f. sp. tritici CRL 75-36-700-3]EFP89978.1 hypothetical protein PGTG_16266 [Puccinia graminis f. sp. tritici CRL 75-36-700-3]
MHGVKRSKGAPSQPRPLTAEEDAQLAEYKRLNQELLGRHALKGYSESDSLSLSTMVLRINPEHVTAWSFRRHCLLTLRSQVDSDQANECYESALRDELPLTLASFQRNPKAYPIWEHRKWVLGQMTEADWQAELALLEKLFKLDGRNFHAWDYRRYVISRIKQSQPSESLDADELAFSGQQIEANFSNFSAWHYRSKLLQSRLDQYNQTHDNHDGQGRKEKEEILATELEWVRGALWIDPNDQSAWLFHRWLLSQTQDEQIQAAEYASIAELLEVEPDAKWAIAALIRARPVEHVHLLDRLIALDPLRRQRYLDLANPTAELD